MRCDDESDHLPPLLCEASPIAGDEAEGALDDAPPGPSPVAALMASPTGRLLALEAPRAWSSEILGGLAPLVREGRALYCVDAANGFDPYVFSRHARRFGTAPEAVLDRVFVTRTFTIHQLEAVIREMLPPLAQDRPPPLLAVLGLDHLFLEESLPVTERRQVLERVTAGLEALRGAGLALLATYEAPPPAQTWWASLHRLGDEHLRATRTHEALLFLPGGAADGAPPPKKRRYPPKIGLRP